MASPSILDRIPRRPARTALRGGWLAGPRRLLLAGCLGLALSGTGSGCDGHIADETRLFELAEERLQVGDYEGARTLYRQFIQEHPQSTLRTFATRRLATLDRELDAIMGRRGAPAPVHVPPPGSERFRTIEPAPAPVIAPHALPTLND